MKTIRLILSVVAFCLVVAGCEEVENQIKDTIKLNRTEFEFSAEAEEISFIFNPVVNWRIEVHDDWVRVNPSSGSASGNPATATIYVNENTGEARSAELKFIAGSLETVLTVRQASSKPGAVETPDDNPGETPGDDNDNPDDNPDDNPGGGNDGGDDNVPGGAAIGWLELPAKGNISTASEYVAKVGKSRNYTAYYNTGTYSSLWVAYPLARGHMGSLGRPGDWTFAPGIKTSDQVDVTGKTYNDGYRRGHQIANSDRNGIREMQLQTFYVINSAPQIQDRFNGYIWQALESAVQNAVPSSDSLYIATGPVYKTVGGNESIKYTSAPNDSGKRLPVANYYFKVVLKVKRSGGTITDAKAVGFWFEHKDYTDQNYEKYAVTVDEIERKTGYDFFANLPENLQETAEKNSSWSSFRNF